MRGGLGGRRKVVGGIQQILGWRGSRCCEQAARAVALHLQCVPPACSLNGRIRGLRAGSLDDSTVEFAENLDAIIVAQSRDRHSVRWRVANGATRRLWCVLGLRTHGHCQSRGSGARVGGVQCAYCHAAHLAEPLRRGDHHPLAMSCLIGVDIRGVVLKRDLRAQGLGRAQAAAGGGSPAGSFAKQAAS